MARGEVALEGGGETVLFLVWAALGAFSDALAALQHFWCSSAIQLTSVRVSSWPFWDEAKIQRGSSHATSVTMRSDT